MSENIQKACQEIKQKFSLSGTEHHIVLLISQGHSPQEIADIRERSIETIRTQIKQIMQKMNVNRSNSIVLEVFRVANLYESGSS